MSLRMLMLLVWANSLNIHHYENLKTYSDVLFKVNMFLTNCDEVIVSDK
jgi:hypothetical protein